jgi:hypothetical protein
MRRIINEAEIPAFAGMTIDEVIGMTTNDVIGMTTNDVIGMTTNDVIPTEVGISNAYNYNKEIS